MPPKKKGGRNGFFQFMMDMRDKHPNITSMQELQEYAGKRWQNMSKEQRKPYDDRACYDKNNATLTKYTTEGVAIDVIERRERDAATQKQEMRAHMKTRVQNAKHSGCLDSEEFLIVHVNILIYCESENRYYPCEIAVAPFSLKEGVKPNSVFHRIVKPGKLPIGFYGEAKLHSKETHQLLDLVQEDPDEDNTEEVFKDLIKFLKQYKKDGAMPVLYAPDKYLDMIRGVMETFSADFGYNEQLKVHNLQNLFHVLRNEVAPSPVWPTDTFSFSEIEKDVYCHTPNIPCEYHDVSDITIWCSRSVVIRYAYIICDHCCPDAGIEMIPGFHVPSGVKILKLPPKSNSRTTSMASNLNFDFKPHQTDSVGTPGYSSSFPSLGARSTASLASNYSSSDYQPYKPRAVQIQKSYAGTASASRASSSNSRPTITDSVRNMSLNEPQLDFSKLNFPEPGYNKWRKSQDK